MNDICQPFPNYFKHEWPGYYHTPSGKGEGAGKPLVDGFFKKDRLFYLRHCMTAAELYLLSLIFSIILDILWLAVHGDYLHDYGHLPYNVDFSIKAIVGTHRFVFVVTIVQVCLKLFSIYWIVWYIRFLSYIFWYLIPAKGAAPIQFQNPKHPAPEIPAPDEPPLPAVARAVDIAEPSLADL